MAGIVHAEVPEFSFSHLNQDKGLIHNSVHSVYQDKRGFLWIATEHGLDRYDGVKFKHYTNVPTEATPTTNNTITCLYEDSAGTLWAGTYWNGLTYYNQATDSFIAVQDDAFNRANGKPGAINTIYEDRAQNLWVGSQQGLIQYDRNSKQFTHYQLGDSNIVNNINSIIEDAQGQLWVATLGGLWLKDLQQKFTNYHLGFDPIDNKAEIRCWTLLLNKQGQLFINTAQGISVFDITDKKVVGRYLNDVVNDNARPLLFYDDQTLLVGTLNGLEVLALDTGRYRHYQHDDKDSFSLAGNSIRSLYCDHSGTIWLGSDIAGLDKFSPYEHKFKLYRHNPLEENSISGNYIRGILVDSQDRLWVCTQFDGLNCLDRKTGIIKHYRQGKSLGAIASDNAYAIFEDHTGTIWVGFVGNQGLQSFDPQTETFRTNTALPTKLTVRTIFEDHKHNLWVGTDKGLYCLAANRQTVTFYNENICLFKDSGVADVQAVFEDHLGHIWVGLNGGVVELDTSQSLITKYDQTMGLAEPAYYCSFLEDRQGDLWITSKGAGIYRYDQAHRHFTNITKKDGLPDNNTYGIFLDKNEQLWLSSDAGIIKYDVQNQQFKSYGTVHGLQGLEFNRQAFYQTRQGEIFFGGTNGLNSFIPEEIRDNPYIPPIIISALVVNGNDYPVPNSLNLNYNQNNLAIEFAALDFSAPEKHQYAYKLEGFDKDWQKGSRAEVNYANLSPGRYIFKVKGSNSDGIWNEVGTTLEILIAPPWWQTPGAYLFYVLSFASLSFSAFWFQNYRLHNQAKIREAKIQAEAQLATTKVQTRALEKENHQRAEAEAVMRQKNLELETAYTKIKEAESALRQKNAALTEANLKLQEIDQLKSNFTAMLVHDLKSPLATVMAALDLIGADETLQHSEVFPFITASEKNIEKILNLVNEVLELYRGESQETDLLPQPVEAPALLQEYVESVRLAALKKNITLNTIIPNDLPMVNVDLTKMDRAFSNLLTNAIKFTPDGGQVGVKAYTEGLDPHATKLVISITDTGEGIPPEDLPYLFEPYRQAKSKQHRSGVGLGLTIVKRILTAHGGDITVESQLGVGSNFTITLPALAKTSLTTPVVGLFPPVPVSSLSTDKKRILIVEDDTANQFVTQAYLKKLGYDVDIVSDGRQVLDKVTQNHYDLILMDIYMPKMDGYQTTKELRQLQNHPTIPVIAMTGEVNTATLTRCLSVGINDILVKPYKIDMLKAVLDKWLANTPQDQKEQS